MLSSMQDNKQRQLDSGRLVNPLDRPLTAPHTKHMKANASIDKQTYLGSFTRLQDGDQIEKTPQAKNSQRNEAKIYTEDNRLKKFAAS